MLNRANKPNPAGIERGLIEKTFSLRSEFIQKQRTSFSDEPLKEVMKQNKRCIFTSWTFVRKFWCLWGAGWCSGDWRDQELFQTLQSSVPLFNQPWGKVIHSTQSSQDSRKLCADILLARLFQPNTALTLRGVFAK